MWPALPVKPPGHAGGPGRKKKIEIDEVEGRLGHVRLARHWLSRPVDGDRAYKISERMTTTTKRLGSSIH